jgi:hypothetical protein
MPSAIAGWKPAQAPRRTGSRSASTQPSARRNVSGRMIALRERAFWPDGASAPTRTRAAGSAVWIAGAAARTRRR